MARGAGCDSEQQARPRHSGDPEDTSEFAELYARLRESDRSESDRVKLVFRLAVDERVQPSEPTLAALSHRFPTRAPLLVAAAPGMPSVLHLRRIERNQTLCGQGLDEAWQEVPDSFWRQPTGSLWARCPHCLPPGGVGPGEIDSEPSAERQSAAAGRIAVRLDELIEQGVSLNEPELLELARRETLAGVHGRIADRLTGDGEWVAELILGPRAATLRAEAARLTGSTRLAALLDREDWLVLLREWSTELNDSHLAQAFEFAVNAHLPEFVPAAAPAVPVATAA